MTTPQPVVPKTSKFYNGLWKCTLVTISISILTIAICSGFFYQAYKRTQTDYYPDQTWSYINTIPVISTDHPFAVITASPELPVRSEYSNVDFVLNEQSQRDAKGLSKDFPIHTAGSLAGTDEDVTKAYESTIDPAGSALMAKLAFIHPWDRRTYFIQFWNYALFDTNTGTTLVMMYLNHRFPEHISRSPETRVTVGLITADNTLLFTSEFLTQSKDVHIQDHRNIFYNSTTLWDNVHNNGTETTPWSFSHQIDTQTSAVYATGHFPSTYNCQWDHPDRNSHDHSAKAVDDIQEYIRLQNQQEELHHKNKEKKQTQFDFNFSSLADGMTIPLGVNNGTHISESPIDIEAFIKANMKSSLIAEQIKKQQDSSSTTTSTSPNTSPFPSHQFGNLSANDRELLAEESTFDYNSSASRQAYECTSLLTFNFTIFPQSAAFANFDMKPQDSDKTSNIVHFTDFIQQFMDVHAETSKKSAEEKAAIVKSIQDRRLKEDEIFPACKNGVSFLHGYSSVSDGFLTLSPLSKAQIKDHLIHFHIQTTLRSRRIAAWKNGQNDSAFAASVETITYTPNQELIDNFYHFGVAPIHTTDKPLFDTFVYPLVDQTAMNKLYQQRYTRDYRDAPICGDLDMTGCVQGLPLTKHQQILRDTLQHEKPYFPATRDNALTAPGYRYSALHKIALTTLTPSTITFWSYAPQVSMPSLQTYLSSKQSLVYNNIVTELSSTNTHTPTFDHIKAAVLPLLNEAFLWDFNIYINRFKWYAGSSYGCCLTRGTPSYQNPWAWFMGTHTTTRDDHNYVLGFPTHMHPNGTQSISSSLLSTFDQQIKQLLENELNLRSYDKDYTNLLINHFHQLFSTLKTNQFDASSLVTTKFPLIPALSPALRQSKQLHSIYGNDIAVVFGDARLDTFSPLGAAYGTYTFSKIPTYPHLATRGVHLKEALQSPPNHPWSTEDFNAFSKVGSYEQTNPRMLSYEETKHVDTNHFSPRVDFDKQIPILPALTHRTFNQLYRNIDVNNNKFINLGDNIIDNIKTQFDHYSNNLPFTKASSDGHSVLWNVTNTQFKMHQDYFGSIYTPMQRSFTQETRTQWMLFHASRPFDEVEETTFPPLPTSTFRALLPMWLDMGDTWVNRTKESFTTYMQVLKKFHLDLEQTNYLQLISPGLKQLLYSDAEIDELMWFATQLDGSLTLYSDLRTSYPHTSILIYKKHYIAGGCDSWYKRVGKSLQSAIANENGSNDSSSKIADTPTQCPPSGDYRYSIWCEEYTTSKLPSYHTQDPLDIFYKDNRDQPGSCIVYSKHIYVPKATMSTCEHAYEASVAVDMNFLLQENGKFLTASARKKRFDLIKKEMYTFYTLMNLTYQYDLSGKN